MSLYAWIVAIGLAAIGGFVGGSKYVHSQWTAEKLARAEVASEAQRQVRMVETKRAAGAQEALDGYARKTRKAVGDAASAATELERLRNALAAGGGLPASPEAAISADETGRLRFIVGECSGKLEAVARAGRACSDQLTALQEWVKAVSSDKD